MNYHQPAVSIGLPVLDFFTTGTHISEHLINTQLIYDPHSLGGNTQFDEPLFRLNPKPVLMKVWNKAPSGAIFGVGNVISDYRALASNLTYFRHLVGLVILGLIFCNLVFNRTGNPGQPRRARLYTRTPF
jgi:hypothetical protein